MKKNTEINLSFKNILMVGDAKRCAENATLLLCALKGEKISMLIAGVSVVSYAVSVLFVKSVVATNADS